MNTGQSMKRGLILAGVLTLLALIGVLAIPSFRAAGRLKDKQEVVVTGTFVRYITDSDCTKRGVGCSTFTDAFLLHLAYGVEVTVSSPTIFPGLGPADAPENKQALDFLAHAYTLTSPGGLEGKRLEVKGKYTKEFNNISISTGQDYVKEVAK